MSFLEMLDVVNEELIRQGRGADRVRLRLPRGHLRHLRAAWSTASRTGPTPAPPSASCTCGASRTATRSRSSRGARAPSRSSRTWSSIAAPSTASSRPAATSRSTSARRPDGNAIPVPKDVADAAMDCGRVHRLRRLRRRLQERLGGALHGGQDRAPGAAAAGPARAASAASRAMVDADGRRGLRRLLERGRVRGGLPEGDLDCRTSPRMTASITQAVLSGAGDKKAAASGD